MNRLTILSLILISFNLTACSTVHTSENDENTAQLTAISLWRQCVDDSLQQLGSDRSSLNPIESIEHTLVTCRGYREDVLATFPQRLEQPLDKLMVRQTYEAGYTTIAAQSGISLPLQSLAFEPLVQQNVLP